MSLMKDNRIVYGAVAAVAVLISAAIFYKIGDSSEEEEPEISIGPLKRDA